VVHFLRGCSGRPLTGSSRLNAIEMKSPVCARTRSATQSSSKNLKWQTSTVCPFPTVAESTLTTRSLSAPRNAGYCPECAAREYGDCPTRLTSSNAAQATVQQRG
jgi:hypothetical protein